MDINAIWASIESNVKQGARELILRRLNNMGLHMGYDLASEKRIVVFEIEENDRLNIRTLPKWAGIDFKKTKLGTERYSILIKLLDDKYLSVFNALIKDINFCVSNAKTRQQAYIFLLECLQRWKHFFEKYGAKGLSKEAQRGLFGELYFLYEHVLRTSEPLDAVDYWRGHDRKHQDYAFPNGNVEIKTTIQKEHKTVIISSEKQLDEAGLASLYLYCLSMDTLEKCKFNLPELIKNILAKLEKNPAAIERFRGYLNQAGYLDEHEYQYVDTGYILKKEYFFRIQEGFPRIINLPEGIGDIKYSIVLSACSDYHADINAGIRALTGEENV